LTTRRSSKRRCAPRSPSARQTRSREGKVRQPSEAFRLCAWSAAPSTAGTAAELAKRYRPVIPVYIRQGLSWERDELPSTSAARPCSNFPVGGLYRNHWSITGRRVPGAKSRRRSVYLPAVTDAVVEGRCGFANSTKIPVIGGRHVGHNPFPDRRPKFFSRTLPRWSGVKVIAPFPSAHKSGKSFDAGLASAVNKEFFLHRAETCRHCGRLQ